MVNQKKKPPTYNSSSISDAHDSDMPSNLESFMDVSLIGSDLEDEPDMPPVKVISWAIV